MPIWLLRHGQSTANVAGVVSDDPALPWGLTPLGITQARTAAGALGKLKFVAVYVSEHRRTRQTVDVLLATRQLSGGYEHLPALHTDARLNERHSNMDGRPVEDFDGLVRPDPVHIRPPGGETFLELVRRVRGFLEEVAMLHGTWPRAGGFPRKSHTGGPGCRRDGCGGGRAQSGGQLCLPAAGLAPEFAPGFALSSAGAASIVPPLLALELSLRDAPGWSSPCGPGATSRKSIYGRIAADPPQRQAS